ncbi:MAG TPA: response regulator transcription factor [Roseiflexaceae bacterium]|nr:response regulator transcription factor [Roseiflexaceae bacterium]
MGDTAADRALIRVVLVDNHPSYRTGLRSLLERERDITVLGEANTADEALPLFERLGGAIDVLVLDVDMPGIGGIAATRELIKRRPDLPILLLTAFSYYAQAGIEAGARGFVLKEQPTHEVIQAIRAIHQGATPLHTSAQSQLVETVQGKRPCLTPRELDILIELSNGASTQDLQAHFAFSESAISRLLAGIEAKLEALSRTHAVAIAIRHGLIQ